MKHSNSFTTTLCLALLLAVSIIPVTAQDMVSQAPSANAEVIGLIDSADEKVTALAGAMNDDQWAWRPTEGVRSTSEVFMHIALANYMMPSMMGAMPPEDFPVTMGPEGPVGMDAYEATTGRETVMAALDGSFDHVRAALSGISADRMDEEIDFFGNTMTVRGFCIMVATHMHEHLGQLIAYARMNEVLPPWTAAEAAAADGADEVTGDGADEVTGDGADDGAAEVTGDGADDGADEVTGDGSDDGADG